MSFGYVEHLAAPKPYPKFPCGLKSLYSAGKPAPTAYLGRVGCRRRLAGAQVGVGWVEERNPAFRASLVCWVSSLDPVYLFYINGFVFKQLLVFDGSDRYHAQAVAFVRDLRRRLVTNLPVIMEVVYILAFASQAQLTSIRLVPVDVASDCNSIQSL